MKKLSTWRYITNTYLTSIEYRNGKCANKVIGKGTIGRWPSKIAEYLHLKNPAGYTGHSFRRTSATLLVNKGEDIIGLKGHGGWKSSSTAEGYIEESVGNKIKFAKHFFFNGDKKEMLKPSTSTSNQEEKENCNDIAIHKSFSAASNSHEKGSHQLQERNEFPVGANILSFTSMNRRSEFWGNLGKLASLVGLWPFQFNDKPKWNRLYITYSKACFLVLEFFIVALLVETFQIINKERLDYDELCLCIGSMLIFFVSDLIGRIIQKEGIKKILNFSFEFERRIQTSKDEEIIHIYANHVKYANTNYLVFIIIYVLSSVLIFTAPLLLESDKTTTLTFFMSLYVIGKFSAVIQSLGYLFQLLFGMCALFIFSSNMIFFGLIIFPVGQLKILQYKLTNFHIYSRRLNGNAICSISCHEMFRKCIEEHHDIISYIDDLNKTMRTVILFDYIQSSLQLAATFLAILFQENVGQVVVIGQSVITLSTRLLILYWNGNEILFESQKIGVAVWNSMWYEQDISIQKMMVFLLARSQHPLKVRIGGFGIMSTGSLIAVLKGTYTYLSMYFTMNQ